MPRSKTAPQVTVGLPVYNGMPYLREAMSSLLAQTYSDFDIMVVDDGSTDDSLEYLRSIPDPRLRILTQENSGITATLNRMLREVASPWLARHDADDVAYPTRLARVVQEIGKFPDSGMFYSFAEYYPDKSLGRFRSTRGSPNAIRELVRSGYMPCICHPSVTLNVQKAIALGGYRFNLHAEDIDLWWRMALQHEIHCIPEALIGFRQNFESVSSNNLPAQVVNGLFIQYLLLSHLNGFCPRQIEEIKPVLQQLVDPAKLRCKERLRAFNMELGQGNRLGALREAASAFVASPAAFLQRGLDELLDWRTLGWGEDPARFFSVKSELWPAGVGQTPIGEWNAKTRESF